MKTFFTKIYTPQKGIQKKSFLIIFVIILIFLPLVNASSATGVPKIINFQGRLMDSSGALLGGPSGTDYCYKFSLYDAVSAGSKIWPAGDPSTMTITTREGVFDAQIGGAGGDALTLPFTDDQVFLKVEVATKVGDTCAPGDGAENFTVGQMSPRQQIVSSAFAINAGTAGSVTNATFTTALTVNTGTLTLTADASNTSVLTIGAGAVSVSGANTGDNAANSSIMYIGTTSHALNRASATEALTGITGITPTTNFTLTQNSVAPFTSVESGAVVNTLYLKEGNVGIGTTTPASLLDVTGGLTTVGSVLTLGTKETSVVANDVLGRMNFYAPLDAAGSDANLVAGSILAIAEDTFSATVNKTSLQFQTGASETATTKMTILSSGNVGIGQTAPGSLLSVAGGISAGSYSATTAPANGMIISGNVGIGTTGPGATLHVDATRAFTDSRTITIDHTKVPNTDQSNFPVLISGTYDGTGGEPDLRTTGNGGKVQNANGYDIYFYSDSALTARIPAERESYNATTGAVNFWVKVSTVATAADTVIYMAYGNSEISTDPNTDGTYGATSVWNTDFKGVWHLNDTGDTLADSTSGGHTATKGTTGKPILGTGKIGNGQLVAGSAGEDYATFADTNNLGTNLTLSAWIYYHTNFGSGMAFRDAGTNYLLQANTNITTYFQYVSGTGGRTPLPAVDGWHHYAIRRAGTSVSYYIDGAQLGTTETIGSNSNHSLDSGDKLLDNWYSDSKFDELKASNITRSADWIATEYANQNDPSTFYTIGNEISINAAIFAGGNIGIGTTAPDQQLEINSATGLGLRLTYDDSDGSATNYADLQVSSAGEFNIQPSGFIANIGGGATATEIRFLEPSGSGINYSAFKAVTQGANITYSLPATVGGAGTYLKDIAGNGVLSWATPAGSGDVIKVGTPVNNQIGVWTGDGTLEGNASLTWDSTSFNIATAKNFQIAGATILADATGTTTLSNIDALDATTEATIEGAIDTLSNLTSIGTIGTGVWQGTTIKANYLQQVATDLGDADITVDLTNSNTGNVTNLTIDGIFQALSIGIGNVAPSVGLELGSTTAGLNQIINATIGSELAPALTTGNWDLGTGWRYLTTPDRLDKNDDGTGTATPTAATTIVAGTTYKIVIIVDSISGSTATYTLGGSAGTTSLSAATTYTDYITASTTGKLIITPVATDLRITISSISIKALTDATGDLTIYGNLRTNSPAYFMGSNVGIGTTEPGAALDINGNLIFSEGEDRTLSVAIDADGVGNALTVVAGAGKSSGFGANTGGTLTLVAGDAGGTGGAGGDTYVKAGDGSSTTGSGGEVYIFGGASPSNSLGGGDVYIRGGSSASASLLGNIIMNVNTSNPASSGNVGIGTTSPASLLDVTGGLTTVGSVLTLGTKETSVVANDVLGRMNFYAPLDAAGSDANLVAGSILAIAEDTFSATVNKTSLQFQTGASETATTKMTILSSGNVGIGNIAPSVGLELGSTTAGLNQIINATIGSELAPALTTGNWDLGTGWRYLTTPDRLDKNADGTGTATPTAATNIVAGTTYKVVIIVDSISGSTATYTLGGSAGTTSLSAATTYTDYITASTTGKLIITPVATGLRITISSISIKALTDATGDLTIYGNLRTNSPAYFMGGNIGIGTTTLTEALNLQGNFKFNDFTFKKISTTEMGLYDSGNNAVLIFDEGTTGSDDPIWGQALSEEFILGSFYQTVATPENIVRLEEKTVGEFYPDGTFTTVTHEFDVSENFQKFTASAEIPTGTNITAKLESSDDNFSTIKSVLDINIKNGLKNYDAWNLLDAKYFRVTFNFETTNTFVSSKLISFEIQGIISSEEESLAQTPQQTSPEQLAQIESLTVPAIITTEDNNKTTTETFTNLYEQIKNVLSFSIDTITGLPKVVMGGIVEVTKLVVDKITANTARIGELEMVDRNSGEIYCTWIEDGQWKIGKGECSTGPQPDESLSQIQSMQNTSAETPQTQPAPTSPSETPVIEPTPTPVSEPALLTSEAVETPTSPEANIEAEPARVSEITF